MGFGAFLTFTASTPDERQIPELESQRLMQRISPMDRLDNVQLRCEITYDLAKVFARDLKLPLDDYLWEAMG